MSALLRPTSGKYGLSGLVKRTRRSPTSNSTAGVGMAAA